MKRGFVLHHNGPPATCVGRAHTRCVAFWAAVKAYHQAKWPNSNDIAYSFGVCPHGVRFVGRGWDKNQYANGTDDVGPDDGINAEWYSVLAFVGGGYVDDSRTFVPEEKPTPEMVKAMADLIADGRRSGRCGAQVKPHSDWKHKPCPGPTLTPLARAWDNAPLTIQEDDMSAEEVAAINAHTDAVVAAAVKKLVGDPGIPGATLTRIGQVLHENTDGLGAAIAAKVDRAALVEVLADPAVIRPLAAAIVAEAPGGNLDVAAMEAGLERVLGRTQVAATRLELVES